MTETSKIVPFGKYKGQPVEVLAQDRPYLDWLSGQDWFRERYAGIYTLIVNNFTEPSETPDHNALQVLFLDDAFCERFMRATFPGIDDAVRRQLDVWLKDCPEEVEARIKEKSERMETYDRAADRATRGSGYEPNDWYVRPAAECRAELMKYRARHDALSVPIGEIKFRFERAFEVGGVDVMIEAGAYSVVHDGTDIPISITWHEWRKRREHSSDGKIEIKPSVGDDYPAVLRQMRANGSNILFTERYSGVGATETQFIKTFALADIKVVFRCDVEAR